MMQNAARCRDMVHNFYFIIQGSAHVCLVCMFCEQSHTQKKKKKKKKRDMVQ